MSVRQLILGREYAEVCIGRSFTGDLASRCPVYSLRLLDFCVDFVFCIAASLLSQQRPSHAAGASCAPRSPQAGPDRHVNPAGSLLIYSNPRVDIRAVARVRRCGALSFSHAPDIHSCTFCRYSVAWFLTGPVALQRPQMQYHFPPHYTKWLALSEELHGHMGCVNRIAWNEDGTKLASGSDDRKVGIPDRSLRIALKISPHSEQ